MYVERPSFEIKPLKSIQSAEFIFEHLETVHFAGVYFENH